LNDAKQKLIGLENRPPDSHYSINVTLSDIMSLDRDLPDTRPKICSSIQYDTLKLPRCTVIIPFFNEAPTMILRAVHSVLNRSPAHLLDEIILGKHLLTSVHHKFDINSLPWGFPTCRACIWTIVLSCNSVCTFFQTTI
jgi:hypothetical protein